MTQRAFGHPDPLQDLRRVRTAQILSDAVNGAIGAGGGLENKIYLWPADGSPLSALPPDATGLNDALTAARDGDGITIPSVQIDLVDPVTLPIGVMVLGLSRENTILSFTTLNNESAVILQARSVLEHLTVTVDGTQPLVGVDARAALASVREVTVNMASHANNVKIYAGYPESA